MHLQREIKVTLITSELSPDLGGNCIDKVSPIVSCNCLLSVVVVLVEILILTDAVV